MNTLWVLVLEFVTAMVAMNSPVKLAAVAVFAFVLRALWNVAVTWLRLLPSEDSAKPSAAI